MRFSYWSQWGYYKRERLWEFQTESREDSEQIPVRLLNGIHWRFWTESSMALERNPLKILKGIQWGCRTEFNESIPNGMHWGFWTESSKDCEQNALLNGIQRGSKTDCCEAFKSSERNAAERNSISFANGIQWGLRTDSTEDLTKCSEYFEWNPSNLPNRI